MRGEESKTEKGYTLSEEEISFHREQEADVDAGNTKKNKSGASRDNTRGEHESALTITATPNEPATPPTSSLAPSPSSVGLKEEEGYEQQFLHIGKVCFQLSRSLHPKYQSISLKLHVSHSLAPVQPLSCPSFIPLACVVSSFLFHT